MVTTTLRRVGGSVMLAVPPALLAQLSLDEGASVLVAVEDGRLVVAPPSRPRYTMRTLLAECDPQAALLDDAAWTGTPPVGKELI